MQLWSDTWTMKFKPNTFKVIEVGKCDNRLALEYLTVGSYKNQWARGTGRDLGSRSSPADHIRTLVRNGDYITVSVQTDLKYKMFNKILTTSFTWDKYVHQQLVSSLDAVHSEAATVVPELRRVSSRESREAPEPPTLEMTGVTLHDNRCHSREAAMSLT